MSGVYDVEFMSDDGLMACGINAVNLKNIKPEE